MKPISEWTAEELREYGECADAPWVSRKLAAEVLRLRDGTACMSHNTVKAIALEDAAEELDAAYTARSAKSRTGDSYEEGYLDGLDFAERIVSAMARKLLEAQ
jgi:hypothetical protein